MGKKEQDFISPRATPSEFAEHVPWHYEMRRPLVGLGDVGSAKTFAVIRGAHLTAKKFFNQDEAVNATLRRPNPGEFFYIVITLSDKEPYDMLVPNIQDGVYAQLPITDLPGADSSWPAAEELFGIIIFDEVTSNPEMLKNVRQMINERKIGNYIVPNGVSFVGTGNRVEDRASSFPLTRDFITAATILDIVPTVEEFLDPEVNTVWQEYGPINPTLALCCNMFADHMFFSTNPPNGADPNTSFNRTRCITAASRMMNHSEFDWSNPVWRQMIRGTMGAQATNTLAGVMSAGDKLVHIERWYGDPQGNREEIREFYLNSKNDAHVKVAFLLFLSKKCKQDVDNFEQCMDLISVFGDEEIKRSFVVTAVSQNNEVRRRPGVAKVITDNKEYNF